MQSPTKTSFDDEVIEEALQSGVDIRKYSKELQSQLKSVENAAIKDYVREAENVACLHNQMQACDVILSRMENMLGQFQSDLGSISSEIRALQEQSISMNLKLRNRQSVRCELSQFVDEMVVPESLINHIMETPVSEREFLEQLHDLHHKIGFVKEQTFRDAKATDDVREVLEQLKLKAVAKIREYFLIKISQFRKPLSNYQIPQNILIKHRFCYEFLLASEKQIAKQVLDEYVDTVSKMFYSYFKTYSGRLFKLLFDDCATREDLLGADDSNKASAMTMSNLFGQKSNIRNKATVFTLGKRSTVIGSDLEAAIIVPHTSQQNAEKYPLEALFRSLQYCLLDNACREYLFLCDFFIREAGSQRALELFEQVFDKALVVTRKTSEAVIADCYDAIALILCISVVSYYQLLVQKRHISALDGYWQSLNGVLWSRFEQVMQLNIESVHDACPQKKENADFVRPHYIVRRYAEFAAAMAEINRTFPSERLVLIMSRLQMEVENFITRMSSDFTESKKRLIFLINNYDLLLSVLAGKSSEESADWSGRFRELLATRTTEYTDEILFPHFGALINFVKECEPLVESNRTDILKRYSDKVPAIIKSFNSSWKKALESINHEIMGGSFPNLQNGSSILQATLTNFIQHYQKFCKILASSAFNALPKNELINLHHVIVEVKKHKSNF